MREQDLPAPGIGAKGFILRRLMAQTVSYMQVTASANSRRQYPAAATFSAFLAAVKAVVDELALKTPILTLTPSAKTYSIAAGATAGPTLGKDGSGGTVSYTSSVPAKATVNSATGAVTGVAVGTTVITATVAAATGYRSNSISYTATVTA